MLHGRICKHSGLKLAVWQYHTPFHVLKPLPPDITNLDIHDKSFYLSKIASYLIKLEAIKRECFRSISQKSRH